MYAKREWQTGKGFDENMRFWPLSCYHATISDLHQMETFSTFSGPLCREFTRHYWIPLKKGQWRGALMFSFISAGKNGRVINRDARDLSRHRTHYGVTVMKNIGVNSLPWKSLVQGFHLIEGILQGCFRLCRWLSYHCLGVCWRAVTKRPLVFRSNFGKFILISWYVRSK